MLHTNLFEFWQCRQEAEDLYYCPQHSSYIVPLSFVSRAGCLVRTTIISHLGIEIAHVWTTKLTMKGLFESRRDWLALQGAFWSLVMLSVTYTQVFPQRFILIFQSGSCQECVSSLDKKRLSTYSLSKSLCSWAIQLPFFCSKWNGSVPQVTTGQRRLGHMYMDWWGIEHIKSPWLYARQTFAELSTCDLRGAYTILYLTIWWYLLCSFHLWPSEVESLVPLADGMSGMAKNSCSHVGSTVQSSKTVPSWLHVILTTALTWT